MTNKEKGMIGAFTSAMVIIIAVVVAVSMLGKSGNRQASENQALTQSQATHSASASQATQSTADEQVTQGADDTQTAQGATDTQTTQAQGSSAASTAFIGTENAKQIALTDSGQASNTAIVFTKQKQERDEGVEVYELEFHDGATEYEYEINAVTGDIISKSSEPYDFD